MYNSQALDIEVHSKTVTGQLDKYFTLGTGTYSNKTREHRVEWVATERQWGGD